MDQADKIAELENRIAKLEQIDSVKIASFAINNWKFLVVIFTALTTLYEMLRHYLLGVC